MKKADYEILLDKIMKELEAIEEHCEEHTTAQKLAWLINNIQGARG